MSPKSTGRYVTTTVAGELVKAFVPDPLPPQLSAQQLATLAEPLRDLVDRWGGRGFVLHSADYAQDKGTLTVDDRFGMTATLDVLQDIARGRGPA